ncbi:nucleotide exchange factor SIL1-like [Lytechinus variegatus]|uniref:nucleotide exchange factor SIL1-like n=1 Tax=Lytechinus variegatus TaxID=7654 RepID=UPI001BB1A03D|nr:nucleotide exchange factor SIL1-like [Lytechinus variegatus]
MAAFRSTLMGILLLSVILHISLLCGVISMGTDSTAVTLHETEAFRDSEEDEDGVVDLVDDQEILEVFKPSDEWQPIKEGQAIPAGLHVRINLATGEKEAKYLDDQETSLTGDKSQEKVENNVEEMEKHHREELQERLAKMTDDDKCDDCNDNEALIEEVKQRYRSIEEIKKEFSKLEVDIKTDYEIMAELLDEYRKRIDLSPEARKLILQDLEFFVHKVDNGVDFASLGGWDVIMGALNSTEVVLNSEAAHVLGSAVQSNPKAQVSAFDSGALHALLHVLSRSPSITVKKRALYGLSSLIRLFPFAQRKFIELGGLSVLSGLMRETSDYLPLLDNSVHLIQVKSVTLVHDLLVEQRNAFYLETSDADEVAKERKSQYEKVNLVANLIDGGWCNAVPMLLDEPDHDSREKILLSLNTFQSFCDYSTNLDLHHRLETLRKEYSALAGEETRTGDGDDYFHSLHSSVDGLLEVIGSG